MTRNRWLMLAGTTTALVLGVNAFSWARGGAVVRTAGQASENPPPPSAGLLRRLAESADAFRNGRVVYLVAQDSGNYAVRGGFDTRESAQAMARRAGSGWYVYPTLTAYDKATGGTPLMMSILPGCYKDTMTTEWICPPTDSTGAATLAMRLQDVVRINVTFVRRTGRPVTVQIAPEHAGATIYTIQDFDRFIVPYYARIFGPAYAARLRESLLSFVARSTSDTTGH